MPSLRISVCIKLCRDRRYKLPYVFLTYSFPCLLDSSCQNIHISCITFQLTQIKIEPIEHMLQGITIYAQEGLGRNWKMANPSLKYHVSLATLRSFLQYVSRHYPARIAGLVDLLKGVHFQEPLYMAW